MTPAAKQRKARKINDTIRVANALALNKLARTLMGATACVVDTTTPALNRTGDVTGLMLDAVGSVQVLVMIHSKRDGEHLNDKPWSRTYWPLHALEIV